MTDVEVQPETPPGPGDTVRASVVDDTRVRLRQHIAGPTPRPTDGRFANAVWGFAQPLLGLRLVLRHSDLRNAAVLPVLGLLVICSAAALLAEDKTTWQRLLVAYGALLALAPVPSVLFGRQYARLASRVHSTLNLGPADPYFKPISRYAWESILQIVVIGAGVAPMLGLVEAVPLVGSGVGYALGGLWALHWIVIESYDSARVLHPDETLEEVELRSVDLPEAWFVRMYRLPPRTPWLLRGPANGFGSVIDKLSREWRAEVQLTERHPAVALGFGLSTAILLGVPGLNLLFRPAVVVGGTHLRAQLE